MIYYVEDDSDIRDLVVYTLNRSAFQAKGFADSTSFVTALESMPLPDLILLDVMLPGEDGLTLLKKIRNSEIRNKEQSKKTSFTANSCSTLLSKIPVIMVTAKTAEFDTIVGLDSGADDYIKKPFSMMELLSRVRAVLRRSEDSTKIATSTISNIQEVNTQVTDSVSNINNVQVIQNKQDLYSKPLIRVGILEIDTACHTASIVDKKRYLLELTLKEYDFLLLLAENPGIAFERNHILERVWGYEYFGETRTVDVHVRSLRKKLSACNPEYENLIETVHGVGYRLRVNSSNLAES